MEKAHLRRALQIAAALIIVALAVGLYRAKSDAAKTEAHVRQLQREISEREADLRALRAEIAQLESPARIEQLAEEELGLVVGGESAALPESAIDRRLPAPRAQKVRE
jgi:cell division protein FtsL